MCAKRYIKIKGETFISYMFYWCNDAQWDISQMKIWSKLQFF